MVCVIYINLLFIYLLYILLKIIESIKKLAENYFGLFKILDNSQQ